MSPTFSRRILIPVLAAVLLAALATWQWLAEYSPTPSPLAQARGIAAIEWSGDSLTLTGRTAPGGNATLNLAGTAHTATASAEGIFTFAIEAEQDPLTRAELVLGDETYELLLVRVRGKWAVLQRGSTARGWMPVVGVHETAPAAGAILSLTKDDTGYAAALSLPAGHTTYVYSNSRLVAVVKSEGADKPVLVPLPSITAQLRLDIYDGAKLAQRLRLTVPPGDGIIRWGLKGSTVWLPTDIAAQKAEVDEMMPGQFIPVDETSAAGAAAPRHTDAPAAQNAPVQ